MDGLGVTWQTQGWINKLPYWFLILIVAPSVYFVAKSIDRKTIHDFSIFMIKLEQSNPKVEALQSVFIHVNNTNDYNRGLVFWLHNTKL